MITNPWAHIKSNKEHGYALAKAFGKEISDPSEVIEFLKSIPAVDLVEKHEILNAKVNKIKEKYFFIFRTSPQEGIFRPQRSRTLLLPWSVERKNSKRRRF